MTTTTKTEPQEQRQRARTDGKYSKLPECPRCHKRKALEPAYHVDDGGKVKVDSKWAGDFICARCIKEES